MKITRVFATACLLVSSVALVTAARISVGDEPGVVRLSSQSPQGGGYGPGMVPAPTPDAMGAMGGSGFVPGDAVPADAYPQPGPYAPYFDRTFGATEMVQAPAYQDPQPFGPLLMFEQNIDEGLGYDQAYTRVNARLPFHLIPNTTVLLGDLSASVTSDGDPIFSGGAIYRNYDAMRNRIFGINGYFDYDEGRGFGEYSRATAGFESLGKYIDFRANGYFILGDEGTLMSDTIIGNPFFTGNNVARTRRQVWENAYSGADLETGGPIPLLGRYGLNAYAGAYYLTSDQGSDTVGFQARWEALITQSVTVNTYLTTDDDFGTNSWVSMQYTIPNYRNKRFLRPVAVRDRLQDPVIRSNRIVTNVDTNLSNVALLNKNGLAYTVLHVNPNATPAGTGTFENPFRTFQQAATANNALVDTIRVIPRNDNSGTNLTANGGITLFDCQTLMSSTKDLTFTDFGGTTHTLPGVPTLSNLGPLISDPNMLAGGSVVRLADQNTVLGMRINAANSAGTVFGNAISNAAPITDVTLSMNTITNYSVGANLQDVSGRVSIDSNNFDGLLGASANGLLLTSATGSTMELLLQNNRATDNSGTGLSVTAKSGSTINADDPGAVVRTGILNNTTNGNGTGLTVEAATGATVNAVIEGNTSAGNTFNGLVARADGGTFNLSSLAQNTVNSNLENGIFIHYLNGGIFRAVSEDADGDSVLDGGEDLNGNGRLDRGIVSNTANANSIAGLCIFGEDASAGVFDMGGPDSSLGNLFRGNTGGGIVADLQDSATAQIDALFNTIEGGNANPGLTIVLDFIDPGQASQVDINGELVNTFDIAPYGFNAGQYDTVTNAILATVRDYYRNLPTAADSPLSTIPEGHELNLDFVIGDTGVAPSNGATEYYVLTIGDSAANLGGLAGQAGDIGNIRNALGQGPGQGLSGTPQALGASAAGIYTNSINQFSPLLNPPNALNGPRVDGGIYVAAPQNTPAYAATALTSGDLTFTRRAIGLVTGHELGHTLSLRHINNSGSVTPTGANALMATPAIDAPIQVRVEPAELALQGTNPGELPGEAPFVQRDIAQLATAIGTRVAAGETGVGIQVNATDNARLLPSTFNNNTINGAENDGIAIVMNDNAVAEGVTIQGNIITGGGGNGVRLEAQGAGAFIDADSTIGGTGVNVYSGTSFTQGNTITNNDGDGFRAHASDGGTIHGNLLNNIISDNGGNGAALLIDNGGTIDFGNLASNRRIQGNTFNGNGGAGIRLTQNVSAATENLLNAIILDNTISNNVAGGIVSALNGPNHVPPALPAVAQNNVLNLTVGGSGTGESNEIERNGDAGIAVNATGNSLVNLAIRNATIKGTTNGPDPLLDGDGISLRRQDASLLLATIEDVTATNNAGDGLSVDVQGNDRNDPNQPLSGTANSVEWNRNNFSSNGLNGASFRTRGDATLLADGTTNTLNRNTRHGIAIQTSENSSFGDPTDGLAPGRRVVFDGNTIEENGEDGVHVLASNDSRALLEMTSTAIPPASGAHAALSSRGDTSISRNAGDGFQLETTGGRSDILITSGTGQTTIDGNGTGAGGGNGIRWDATGTSDATVRVTSTIITNSIAGAAEGPDANNNADNDVANGDGIQFNISATPGGVPGATLVVGGVGPGDGNTIQSNGDDGIAITVTGDDVLGTPRPVIAIVGNKVGGTDTALGNRGDGISLNIFGGTRDATAIGADPANIDATLADDDGLTFSGGVQQSGPIVQMTVSDNLIASNNRKGVNLLLTGAAGERNREFGSSFFDPVRITLTDNTIVSNGEQGVFFRGDSQMNQSRLTYLANFPFPAPFDPVDDRPQTFGFYTPTQAEFLNRNVGSVNGNSAFGSSAPDGALGYLNLRTVQNTLLSVTGNTIQNNGTNTVVGEGLFIQVGTGSYLAADVRDNNMGGNLNSDLRTESFLSAGNTFDSIDQAGDETFDVVYWDDTAQLDLRFQNNSGNQINVATNDGATYRNPDFLKSLALGDFIGNVNSLVRDRDVAFFQVDNGLNLNDPNNTFINFGLTQTIDAAFTAGGYNLRAAADAAFPNIGFAPFLP